MTKELDAALEAVMVGALASDPLLSKLAYERRPLTREQLARAAQRAGEALALAVSEPGSVVKIACELASEAVFVVQVLEALTPKLVNVALDPSRSSPGRYELTNNSAILVGIRDDR
jgi:hypothetical protein